MPVISQNFSHNLETITTNTNIKVYNYKDQLVDYGRLCLEASQYFFDDLKSMLEKITTLNITFSDNLTFEKDNIAPSFKIWGLDFSPCINYYCTHANSYIQHPMVIRHYEYSPWGYSLKLGTAYDNDLSGHPAPYSSRINNAELTEINYTIEITYNTDFIIIDYRPYYNKSIKYTICCLIKGEDINGKTVVYESGGCNTYSEGSYFYNAAWPTCHKLVWGESPKCNPYSSYHSFPSEGHPWPVNRNNMDDGSAIFLDLNGGHQLYGHGSRIKYLDESPYNMSISKPICCWGFVNFSDNILTGPVNLTVDTNYQINGETYYCPGDYIATLNMQAGANYNCYAMKFLLRI